MAADERRLTPINADENTYLIGVHRRLIVISSQSPYGCGSECGLIQSRERGTVRVGSG